MDEDAWLEIEEFLALTQEVVTLIKAVQLIGKVDPNTALLLESHLKSMVVRGQAVQSSIRAHAEGDKGHLHSAVTAP